MESVGIEPRISRPVIRDFVAAALDELAGRDVVGVITVPAPWAPLSAFLGVMPRGMSFVWNNPPSGIDCAGGGVAHRIDVTGHDRLAQLREQSSVLWSRLQVVRHSAAPNYAPRLFGGLAFSASNSLQSPWTEFGDGTFSLARWTYGRFGRDGFLSFAAAGEQQLQGALEELEAILDVLFDNEGCQTPVSALPAESPALSITQFPAADWDVHIEKIREAIASERFLKIVAARRCDISMSHAPSDLDVLHRLMSEAKCVHYAFRRTESTFVGASPELLFLKSGRELRTQALAGTARSGARVRALQPAQLLDSSKDRSEHEFVVAAIRNALAPLCDEVIVAGQPEVLKLRNILHINTPFEARVRPSTHITELLEALHPTPAVGGVPGGAAQEWIVEHERHERGWYTGPVGWFDSDGDAEFAVAIRCGVLAGPRAHLYTGAGVVLDSNPSAEYAETALKQLPMLRALGIERQ
jgi:isochorismate synthase